MQDLHVRRIKIKPFVGNMRLYWEFKIHSFSLFKAMVHNAIGPCENKSSNLNKLEKPLMLTLSG